MTDITADEADSPVEHATSRLGKRGRTAKERIHLLLTKRSMQRLNDLKDKTEATSNAEIFRNALRLYEAIIEELENGNELLIREPSGEITNYKIFW